MYIGAMHDDTPGFERNFVQRTLAFYNDELYLRSDDGQLKKVDAPNSANKNVSKDYLLLELREPWNVGGVDYQAGSLLVTKFDDFMAGKKSFEIVFEPTENSSLASYTLTRNHLILNVLEDVKNRIYVMTATDSGWQKQPLTGAPEIGTVGLRAVDADESDAYWMTSSGYLTPTTLYYGEIGGDARTAKATHAALPSRWTKSQSTFCDQQRRHSSPLFYGVERGSCVGWR